MSIDVSLKQLIEKGAHFGHQSRRWNPKMEPYLHSVREGVHIFDLTKTKAALDEALSLLKKYSKEGKRILFVGTKKQARQKIEDVAKKAGVYYVNERWLGGTITNFDQIKLSTQKLAEMKKTMAEGGYKSRTKKERVLIQREIDRLERFFGGISAMEGVPDLLFVVDIKREKTAVHEANMREIPVIALVDSNCDPTDITYPIPMNDDATKAVEYVLELFGEAVNEGKGINKQSLRQSQKQISTNKTNRKSKSGKSE